MRRRVLGAALGAVLILPALAYDVPGMRDTMRAVFSSMRVLLELSASPDGLTDPANEDAILAATTELADQAAMLSEHAARDEVSFLAASLDRYASWIRRSYEWRRPDSMSALIRDAVDLCMACHTRLPSGSDSPVAEDFLANKDLAALPGPDRARLQIATRRFADALHSLEEALTGDPAAAELPDNLRTYLVVAVRVKNEAARARRTVEALAQSASVTQVRRAQLAGAAAALRALEEAPPAAGDLAAARRLTGASPETHLPAEGADLVNLVAASRLLYEFLEAGHGTVDEGAEAYYLLGLARYRLEPRAWLPQAELYLEKAIRTAPGSAHSRRALALLEEELTRRLGTGGSGLPPDVARHLQMLRELVGP